MDRETPFSPAHFTSPWEKPRLEAALRGKELDVGSQKGVDWFWRQSGSEMRPGFGFSRRRRRRRKGCGKGEG